MSRLSDSALARFTAKVTAPAGASCWDWTAGLFAGSGYGMFWLDGRSRLAHRVSYEHYVGPIPDGLVIDHLCRNRKCVNPRHLEPVENGENIRRGISPSAENLRRERCVRDHPLEGDNLIINPNGRRSCRECRELHYTANNKPHTAEQQSRYNAARQRKRSDPAVRAERNAYERERRRKKHIATQLIQLGA